MPMKTPILLTAQEAEVIRALRKKGQISRMQISDITGWSKAKTSIEIRTLIDKGYLMEKDEGLSEGGRKPKLLKFNDQLGFIVGIDIGATSIDVLLADVFGNILQHVSEPGDVRQPPKTVLAQCIILVDQILKLQGCQGDQILGIGVGVPGPVDFSRGVLVAPPLMPDWENFPIRSFLKEAYPTAYVVVDNDVNIMALGEQRYGDAIGLDHFIFIKIGTGIGSGIISNGKIHRGSNGCAGDIGHICVDKQGPICRCGNRGCLEAMAAGPAITEKAIKAAQNGESELLLRFMKENEGIMTPELVSAACREGDEAALEIIRSSGQMIGDVLASLVNFFNPSHIFIAGGISNFGNHLLVAIKRAVLRRSLPLATTDLQINFSHIGAIAGNKGVIALVLEYLFVDEDKPFLSV
ncbi:MAG: transcriptional regulator [Chloroflexi bacterium HGW-Chloroflexi-8]|nr:MAG: transcriptional regulator [Chloroflexi bacterium HGW-Chloroflexi-8]